MPKISSGPLLQKLPCKWQLIKEEAIHVEEDDKTQISSSQVHGRG